LGALLLFAKSANCGGAYQRTRDGRTLIWNNFPRRGDGANWSGPRDTYGYATGYGTLTWYKGDRAIVTGSNIPASTKGNIVLGRYSGKMMHGKFQGLVANVDANGKTFHGTFFNGSKTGDWIAGLPPERVAVNDQKRIEPKTKNAEPPPPAAGPTAQNPPEKIFPNSIKPSPTEALQAVTPPSTLRAPLVMAAISPRASVPPAPAQPSPSPVSVEPVVRNRIIADFKDETQSVLVRVRDATEDFHEIERLDSIRNLPGPVAESIDALTDRARDFRAKLGYETALRECRTETQTADALSVVDRMIHDIASSGDASKAETRLNDFLKNNPEPLVDTQKDLWRYLGSMRSLIGRSEKDAAVHLQQAQLFVSAGRTADAIREYQEAQRIFPTPATADKIRQLEENSLGL
jgi:hypothetical protein